MIKEPNKYLDQIEKQSSLVGGAIGTHIAQNIATRAALSSRKISRYLANSFSEGAHGVINTSAKSKITRVMSGATVPDIAIAHKKAHELGTRLKPILESASRRQKVGLRMLSEGRVSDLQKYNLHKDPLIKRVSKLANKALGVPMIHNAVGSRVAAVEKIFNDKSHPMASNILKNISRGKTPVGSHYKPGTLNSKLPMLGAVASTAADPAGGALNSVKTLMGSKTFNNNKYGGKISHMLHTEMIHKPLKSGVKSSIGNKTISDVKHKASGLFISPVSAQLKRTSAAFTDALK